MKREEERRRERNEANEDSLKKRDEERRTKRMKKEKTHVHCISSIKWIHAPRVVERSGIKEPLRRRSFYVIRVVQCLDDVGSVSWSGEMPHPNRRVSPCRYKGFPI